MKIAILSDTHDLLRPEVLALLPGCGCILHGGDISSRKILDQLEKYAPVKAVRGNNDKDRKRVRIILHSLIAADQSCQHKKTKAEIKKRGVTMIGNTIYPSGGQIPGRFVWIACPLFGLFGFLFGAFFRFRRPAYPSTLRAIVLIT